MTEEDKCAACELAPAETSADTPAASDVAEGVGSGSPRDGSASEGAASNEPASEEVPTGSAAVATRRRTVLLAGLAAVAIAAAILAAQTISFIARDLPFETELSFGSAGISALINTVDASGAEVSARDGDRLGDGGASVSRIVRASNTGDHSLWVRMRLTLARVDADGTRHDVSDQLSCSDGDGAWERGEDGYWYLTTPLEAGEVSAPLCRGISVAGDARLGKGSYELAAVAYGVQSEHNATSVWDAEGWPEA